MGGGLGRSANKNHWGSRISEKEELSPDPESDGSVIGMKDLFN